MSRAKDFERDIINLYKRTWPGSYVERNVDRMFGKSGISIKSPPDIIFNSNAQCSLIECKIVKGKSLPLSRMSEHQEEYLAKYDEMGTWFHGEIAVMFYGDSPKQWKRAFILNIADYQSFVEENDRKSIPIKYFEENAHELVWRTGDRWCLY